MATRRVCPRAYPDAPHYLEQDPTGFWYCPIERAADREREYLERIAS
jgi:hypothetical protein